MFFIGVKREAEDAELATQVAKHCRQFSLRAPEVVEVAKHCRQFSLRAPEVVEVRETVSQEQVDNLERALFQMGVNPWGLCGTVMGRELCVPVSEEERRRKKQRVAIVTAGVSVAVGRRACARRVRCSCREPSAEIP